MKMLAKNLVSVFLVLLLIASFCSFSMNVRAEEAACPVTVYSEDGTIIARFDSYDEFLESIYVPGTITTYSYVCDTVGHVHGSKTYYIEVGSGTGTGWTRITVCYWCNNVIEKVSGH